MANITQWLEKIKTAMFGKDVREAIYNSINTMNNEVISNTSKQNSLETKYNNQIKNMSLANPSVAEVVDARTSDTGVNYSTLGERLNSERVDGGINLLRSTGLTETDSFEIWTKNSNKDGLNISITDTERTPHHNRCWYISNTLLDENNYGISQDLSYKLMPSTTYTLSLWILPTATDNGDFFPYISYKNSAEKSVFHTFYYKASSLEFYKWNKINYTFTTASDMNKSQITFLMKTQKCVWKGCVGDFKLELGSHTTDWSPAPEDLVYQANQYTNEIKATIDSTYKNRFVKLRPSTDIAFTINTHNIDFDTLISNQDFITESSKNTIPETGVYGINIQVEIYNPGTGGTQSCCGDILIRKNGQLMETTNYGVILENNRANTARASFIEKLNKGDIITVAISNNDPQGRTFDIKHDNSRMTIYKI